MAEKLLEALAREHLDTRENVARNIRSDRPLSQVIDTVHRLSDTIQGIPGVPQRVGTPFVFLPNSNVSAQTWPCIEYECRLGRADRLARFAALWADRVYVQSYLCRWDDPHHGLSWGDEYARQEIANDIDILLLLAPLLKAGIVKVFKPEIHVCETCRGGVTKQLESASAALSSAKAQLRRKAWQSANVIVQILPPSPSEPDGTVCVGITGREDVVPHGARWTHGPLTMLPEWLPASVRRRALRHQYVEYHVPRKRLPLVPNIDRELDMVIEDILVQQMTSSLAGAAFMTDRRLDTVFLNALHGDARRASFNGILERDLMYKMPLIDSIPLEEIVRLRKSEPDAFLVYRDSITRLVQSHLRGRVSLSAGEARDLYDSEIRPSLNKMNARMTTIRTTLSERFVRNITITATTLGLGILTGVSQNVGAALTALGGLGLAKEVVNSFSEAVRPPDELRDEDLYFLWKLGRRPKKPSA